MAKEQQFSANKTAQPVYAAVNQAVRHLPPGQALDVLDEIWDHVKAQADALREEQEAEGD